MEPKGIQAKISAYIEKHPELRLATQEIVLFEMQEAGEISAADIEKVKKGSLFGISDNETINLNSYITIDACKNRDIVYVENIIENICGIPQKEANKAKLGEAVVNILSSNNIELSEENIINVLAALNIIQVNEGPLQPPSDKDARAVATQYILEEINQIIELYESIANSDKSLWTIGTGLVVSVNDVYETIAKKVNDLIGAPLLSEGGNSRQELGPKLYKLRQQCNALAKIVESEANDKNSNSDIYTQTFNNNYKKMFGTDFKSETVVNYLKALQEYQQAPKEERDDVQSDVHKNFINAQQEFEKTNPLNSLSKDIESYAKSMGNVGGLADLGLNIALMYLSGGGAAVAKSAQTAHSLARYSVGKALQGVKISNNAKFIAQEAASILSSTAVNSIETSAFFNATKALAVLEDGKIQADEVALVGESFKGLCDFTAVGGLLAGPLGIKASELTSKLFNSERAIASTIKIAVEGKGTTLDKVLKALSENSNAISKVAEFGTSFLINAGYMAASDGMSYGEAMGSLAQMDAVSKLVVAMLGGKNVSFLTPQKVQQIKTDLAGYQVKMTVFKGKKVYEVTDKTGAKTYLGNEQELFKFIISREISVIEQDIEAEKTAEKAKSTETKPAETKTTAGKKNKISAAEAKKQRAERIAQLDAATVESNIGKHIDEKIFKLDKTDTEAVNEIRKEIRALRKTQPEEAKNLEVLLDAVTQNKQCSDVTTEDIAAVVNHLRRQYSAEQTEMTQLLESFGAKELGHFSSRIKGDMSMFDKIVNFAKKNPDKPFSKAIEDVRDAFGARIVLDSVDMTNVPEVKALLEAGNIEGAAQVASFMNSAKIMDFITKIINSKDGSTITRISNYADGKELSVISSAQMFTLAELAKGKDLVVEGLKDGSEGYKGHQKSGYPALQINIKTKTGRILELQIRYDTVDKYAEAEHLVYDSTTDKDIIGRHEETAPILNEFKEALGDINKEEYNKYSKAQYHQRFLKAFGIETPEPKLEDFAPKGKPFDNRLSANNLLKLHGVLDDLKNGYIKDNSLDKYHKTIGAKTLEGDILDINLTEETPFARQLTTSAQVLNSEEVIKRLENILIKRMKEDSPKERQFVQDIIDKISDENYEVIDLILKDNNISNEIIKNTLDVLRGEYKVNIFKLFTPKGVSIFLLRHFGLAPKITVPSKIRHEYALKMLNNNTIPKELIPDILSPLEKENALLIDYALEQESFDWSSLPRIIESTLYDNGFESKNASSARVNYAKYLLDVKDIPLDQVADLVKWGPHFKNQIIKFLVDTQHFPNNQILPVLENIIHDRYGKFYWSNNEVNKKIDLCKRLINDSICPPENITDVLGAIDSNQFKIFDKLYADNTLPKSEISNILYIEAILKKDINKLNFVEKVTFLTNAVTISDSTLRRLGKYNIDVSKINQYVNDISSEMGLKKTNISTSEANKQLLYRNVLANKQNVESILKDINLDHYKNGIPLKYSRSEFISDINKILNNVNEADKQEIYAYFGMSYSSENSFEGFPIIPKAGELRLKSELIIYVDKITEKIKKFSYENEASVSNIIEKRMLDSIIKGCPEFTTIIGKAQHGTHKYTVDIHTLKVLQNAMKDPMYDTLDAESKTVLKYSILLHDIGKKEKTIDKEHYETSAKYAVGILDKYNLPSRIKSRIIETIYNHHWFEQYNKNNISAQYVNAMYRNPQDISVAMLMAKADLTSVNDNFHFKVTKTNSIEELNDYFISKFAAIIQQRDARYSKSNLVMDTKFQQTDTRKFPEQNVVINGKSIKLSVLNLMDENVSNDLYKYGFANGITKTSARFLVHMNDNIKGLKVFFALSSSPVTESIQSLSMISINNNRTYKNQKYGVITDIDMANIAQASNENIGSGYKKTMKNFTKDLYNPLYTNTFVRDNLIAKLAQKGVILNENEYAQLAESIVNIQYSTQIVNDINIGDKIIKANIIQEALNESREELFIGDSHSEIVAINPRVKALVARVSSIEECSPEFIEMAEKYNLPIVLIGYKNPN